MTDRIERETRIVCVWTAAMLLGYVTVVFIFPVLMIPSGLITGSWMFAFSIYMDRRDDVY